MQFHDWLRSTLILLSVPALISSCPAQSLRQAAESSGVLVGTAVRPYLFSEAAYTTTLAREFNMVEPEDAMKWLALRPSADAFDFRDADAVVRFAQAHNMKVRGHCLVWDHDNPAWLAQGHFTSAQMSKLLQEHISKVMKHYAGQVFAWDVINEALDENGHLRDSPWYNQPGIKSDAIYSLLKDFKQRGVPIDGVGLQMHISSLDFDTAAIAANTARLTALGLQVHITELDVSLPLNADEVQKEDLARQAEVYRGIVRACLQSAGCTAIQTWGFTDKYSWIGSHSHGTRGAALPFDRTYKPKPAYDALRSGLAEGRKQVH